MTVSKELFGETPSGEKVYRYWIENKAGIRAGVINFGAVLVNLFVPDKEGNAADVVLGYDTLEGYLKHNNFFGATVGPNANRIGNASFTLNGNTCQLEVNDGVNNLHSHLELGYHRRVWNAQEGDSSVTFLLEDKDGDMGFPGNKKIQVTYSVTDDNALKIHYQAWSDRDTVLNMTNHSYFNLAGHDKGDICNHMLTIKASKYTAIVPGAIPTGELVPVEGTPLDFLKEKRVGDEIDSQNEQMKMVKGYDHNWVIDGADGTLREIAEVAEPKSGRRMKVYTDLPGVQFYSGNGIDEHVGKEGAMYANRSGLCLETQYFPDTPNKPQFPSSVFGPSREYDTVTIYQFC